MSVADSTKVVPLKGQESILPEVESLSEDCSAPVLCAQSLNSLVDVPSQSKCYCIPTNPPSGEWKMCYCPVQNMHECCPPATHIYDNLNIFVLL